MCPGLPPSLNWSLKYYLQTFSIFLRLQPVLWLKLDFPATNVFTFTFSQRNHRFTYFFISTEGALSIAPPRDFLPTFSLWCDICLRRRFNIFFTALCVQFKFLQCKSQREPKLSKFYTQRKDLQVVPNYCSCSGEYQSHFTGRSSLWMSESPGIVGPSSYV